MWWTKHLEQMRREDRGLQNEAIPLHVPTPECDNQEELEPEAPAEPRVIVIDMCGDD